MRILCIFGTRPEAIKLAPVISHLNQNRVDFDCHTLFSGQHEQMGVESLRIFDLKPDTVLNGVMVAGQNLSALTARLLTGIDETIESMQPDWIVVQGDTSTAFTGALAGFYRKIKVAHVEAGLRTGDFSAPFPEEGNRSCIARLANLHLCPTEDSAANLLAEGIEKDAIRVTGNTVVDAVRLVKSRLPELVPSEIGISIGEQEPLILVTCHRRESFGEPLQQIFRAVLQIVKRFPTHRILFPVHPNPMVAETAKRFFNGRENITLLPPLGYKALLWCMNRASLILSDSGGIQEEAPSFGTPLLILRETTERPEVVSSGCGELVGTDCERIVERATAILSDPGEALLFSQAENPFGDGYAASRIAEALKDDKGHGN